MGCPLRFSGFPSWAVLGVLSGLSLCFGFGVVVGLFHYGAARSSLVAERLPMVAEGRWAAPLPAPTLWTTGEVSAPQEPPRWVF